MIGSMLDLIDEGYHSRELVRRLKKLDRTKHLVGKAMGPEDESLPPTPAAILDARTHATHGRDVVQLVDPASGRELTDGGMVSVFGVSGDGRADSLRLRPRIIGVASDDPIEDVRLYAHPIGAPGPKEYLAHRRVRDGVFEYDGNVHLGRDYVTGETVDLEVRADLPGGGMARWVYRNVRLGGPYWTMQ